MWSDSTTVLTWIQSDSRHFKVFVGTRIAEIQELTDSQDWRYVDLLNNPADDVTRGQVLQKLMEDNRWFKGPPFLYLCPEYWPRNPSALVNEDTEKLCKPIICLKLTTVSGYSIPEPSQVSSFKDLVHATVKSLNGAASTEN